MNTKLETCPNPQVLADFLLGNLDHDVVESYEFHFAQCSPCTETIRAMHVNDTLNELAQDVFEAGFEQNDPAILSDDDQSTVRDLAQRMKQLGGRLSAGALMAYDTNSRSPDDGNAYLEACSAEIQNLLEPPIAENSIGQLAHYRIVRLLGAGATGVVYLATDENLNRDVALKVLRPSLGKTARERFIAEARGTAAINAPNVVSIYHVGTEGPLAYIAMQWAPGETLEQRLKREERLPTEQVRVLSKQIAEGLSAAHQIGLIHRDIKPANIWLESETDVVKILDFGLVRATDGDPRRTCTGMIAGTPSYMSPEQSRGAELDCRSDFFSLGCVIYECLTGRLPFESQNVLATLQSIQKDTPKPPHEIDADISGELSTLVMCLLKKFAEDRPPTAASIGEACVKPQSEWSFQPTFEASIASIRVEKTPTKQLSTNAPVFSTIRWAGAVTACLLFAFGLFMFPQIIRIATNQGELVIETNDSDIKIEVLEDGELVRVIDLKTEQSIEIKSGTYELRPMDDQNSISIDKSTIEMKRGRKRLVRVTRNETTDSMVGEQPSRQPAIATNKPSLQPSPQSIIPKSPFNETQPMEWPARYDDLSDGLKSLPMVIQAFSNSASNAAQDENKLSGSYRIQTGDVIGISSSGVPKETNGGMYPWLVNSLGNINYPNVGPIKVTGKKLEQLGVFIINKVNSETIDQFQKSQETSSDSVRNNSPSRVQGKVNVGFFKKRPTLGQFPSLDSKIIPLSPSQPSQIQACIKQKKSELAKASGQYTSNHPSVQSALDDLHTWEAFLADSLQVEEEIISKKTRQYQNLVRQFGLNDSTAKKLNFEIMELKKGRFVYEVSLVLKEAEIPDDLWKPEQQRKWRQENTPDLLKDFKDLREKYWQEFSSTKLPIEYPGPTSLKNQIRVLDVIIKGFAETKN